MKIDVKFNNNLNSFPVSFDEKNETFDTQFSDTNVVEIVTSDHSKLINRDKENQHPIKAIEGLENSLTNKVDSSNSLTNFEILEILNR